MDIKPNRADTEVVEMIDGLFKVAPEGGRCATVAAVTGPYRRGILRNTLLTQGMPM